ncbi:aldehyde dehydrogenase family protein [Streptomyces sp. GD-15H]|uniref:aldehyde dehydrogenase family protein n=1 Tax=Streptomyces sp. GD-15H TaxID=3129112 RepID=UPI0038733E3C
MERRVVASAPSRLALRAGTINANGPGSGTPSAPYGGYKQSGLGREFGVSGVLEYTEVKTLKYSSK